MAEMRPSSTAIQPSGSTAFGVTSVPVRLHGQVRPEVKVWVIQED